MGLQRHAHERKRSMKAGGRQSSRLHEMVSRIPAEHARNILNIHLGGLDKSGHSQETSCQGVEDLHLCTRVQHTTKTHTIVCVATHWLVHEKHWLCPCPVSARPTNGGARLFQ